MTDTLPPGVHPHDASQPWDQHAAAPVPLDTARPLVERGHKPWSTRSRDALPVFQRLGRSCSVQTFVLNTSTTVQRIVARTPGRNKLYLFVPSNYYTTGSKTASPGGVLLSAYEDELYGASGGIPLDTTQSLDWPSESSVWATPLPGNTNGQGLICYVHAWDGGEEPE